MPKKLSIDEVDFTLFNSNLERIGLYSRTNLPVLCICLKCNRYVQPHLLNIRKGRGGCRFCGSAASKEFHTISIDEVDLCLSKAGFQRVGLYRGANKPTLSICLKCENYAGPYLTHIRSGKGGCVHCGHKADGKTRSLTKDIVDATLNNVGLIRIGDYSSVSTAVLCVCIKCNKCVPVKIADIRAKGSGCPACGMRGFNSYAPGYFYVVANHQWIKAGITNYPKQRLRRHFKQGLSQVIHNVYFESGHKARILENQWMDYVRSFPKEYRASAQNIKDGHTETIRNSNNVQQWIKKNLFV